MSDLDSLKLMRLVARGAIAELPPDDKAKVAAAEVALRDLLTAHGPPAKLAMLALLPEVVSEFMKA